MMTRGVTAEVDENSAKGASGGDAIETVSRILATCRTQIDELLVQLDLAKLELREEVSGQVEIAENAYSAARSKLSDARLDANAAVGALRHSLEQLLHDLGRAYTEVDSAVKRGVTR
jgi:hypothetical protein